MSGYHLTEGLFLYPTPSGAYYAVSSNEMDKPRQFIRQMLSQPATKALTFENLQELTGLEDPEKCMEMLHHCQKLGWVQGLKQALNYPSEQLDKILPDMLSAITENGKVLLADMEGFYLASHGFPHEVAEELSALSAEIATVHARRSGVLMNNLGQTSQAWAIVDVFGNSQMGFWPLFIGKNRFVLIISGIPHFNQPEFVSLIWALAIRYATKAS
ncbi:hypothetical protein [Methylomicrobium album]|uniref:Roadblock/LAMTOR2 domain-containing protein n=1 Tax=Methylomicrobium album BG8 TaxID=686340 RepID=H8GLS9_METAL|nr:hypothetical protein [Methylomicrobium album]EIC30606.1 hypothetical protein Metal_2925 [Methylomicrobium album BG8]